MSGEISIAPAHEALGTIRSDSCRHWTLITRRATRGSSEARSSARCRGERQPSEEEGDAPICLAISNDNRWPYIHDRTATSGLGGGRYSKYRPPGRYFASRPPTGAAAGHLAGIVDQNPRRHRLEGELGTRYARVPGPSYRAGAQAGAARRRRRDLDRELAQQCRPRAPLTFPHFRCTGRPTVAGSIGNVSVNSVCCHEQLSHGADGMQRTRGRSRTGTLCLATWELTRPALSVIAILVQQSKGRFLNCQLSIFTCF